jgi:hypothetical protein
MNFFFGSRYESIVLVFPAAVPALGVTPYTVPNQFSAADKRIQENNLQSGGRQS